VWGATLAAAGFAFDVRVVLPAEWMALLTHPFLAPALITVSWIPVEALLGTSLGTTPGKWLFGVYLQFSISDAYAVRDTWTQFRRALSRAFRAWWEGVGCGFPPVAPILIAVAYEKVAEYQETPWDFAEDCLVTHGPIESLNAVTGIAGLAAMLWLYGVAWHQPMGETVAWARTGIAAALPSPSALVGRAWRNDDAPRPAPSVAAAPSPPAAGRPAEIAGMPAARVAMLVGLMKEQAGLISRRLAEINRARARAKR